MMPKPGMNWTLVRLLDTVLESNHTLGTKLATL